jgi:UDP-N-acetylglucosamine--N-acetylmuramyl-(pentapeptide) pyrophosphoryl-undecaprenol N-acetylglucosamine transferase
LNAENYCQFEYVNEELADLFAASTVVISRSGANSLYEILALKKPHVLIPLSSQVSRGDQIQNARHFQSLGISVVIQDQALNAASLLEALDKVVQSQSEIESKINALNIESATETIVAVIKEQVHAEYPRTV